MRAVLTSVMAVLVVVALFWGNCFSCPQLLLEQQKHGCCPHETTPAADCQTQVLKSFVKAEKAPVAPVLAIFAELPVFAAISAEAPQRENFSSYPALSPPLQISLRI